MTAIFKLFNIYSDLLKLNLSVRLKTLLTKSTFYHFFIILCVLGVAGACFMMSSYQNTIFPAGIYLLKVNNRNTRTSCEVCSKLTIKTPELRHSQCKHMSINSKK